MRDVEFVSELFLLTMHGVLDGAPQLLDQFYANTPKRFQMKKNTAPGSKRPLVGSTRFRRRARHAVAKYERPLCVVGRRG